jgi:hypothetical protein
MMFLWHPGDWLLADDQGSFPGREIISSRNPVSYWMDSGVSLLADKPAWGWSCSLTTYNADVKNTWSFTSNPQYVYI